ncbi:MAG: DUF4129 domain-containing protein [Chloroflexi bacterium]|nr:DUF4129 domain-containing protein [Chloroflexota bacterium]MDA1146553.1 DUF4129 domain-containing protein [Chloroflexota bacterium]MQC82757.1 DUF4129 domain-containing protein [Chloroflexota bacterium]PKB56754.1 MAG: hypothetical protein BZY69_00120 [SAR202 cluster bacterium Casp-Chloro-G1]
MTNWQRNLLDTLYVAMETIAWFVAITVVATIGERGYLRQLSRELSFRNAAGDFSDPDRAREVVQLLASRAESATAGPSIWVVMLAGFGGFWLMRGLVQLKLGGTLGAIALVLASVIGLNVLLHVTFAQDLLVWQNQGLASFLDDPQSYVSSGANFQAVVDRGGVVIGGGTAIVMTFVGMLAAWLRFLYAGRRIVRFEHVLRSFGIGFAIILGSLVLARLNDVGQLAVYSVPYFMLGLLALAVANGERAALPAEGRERLGAWGVSVTATLLLLGVIAVSFGLLALLDVTRFIAFVGDSIGGIVEWLLIIILTPIFWILVPIIDFLIPDALAERLLDLEVPQNFIEPENLAEGQEQDDFILPRWPLDVLKVLIFVALVWLSYRGGRALLDRRDSTPEDEFDEFRSDSGGGSGLGGLLRNLIRRGHGGAHEGWFALRPIYGVYGRSVVDAEDRGFERRRSETPLEYSTASGIVLEAPVFREIAEAFDAARYGGHEADPDQVRRWAAELAEWEKSHPPSEELRDQLEQIRPPRVPRPVDPADEFAQRVKRGRETYKRMRSGGGPGGPSGAAGTPTQL